MGIEQSGTRANPRLDLSAAVMEFMLESQELIGTKVFPIFQTQKQAASFGAVTRETIAQVGDTKRSRRSAYNRGSFGTKDKSYECKENGWEAPVDDSERKMYASDFEADMVASKIAAGIVLRNQEIRIAAALQNTSTFTGATLYTDISSSAPFATAGSDIIGAIRTAKGKVRTKCGMLPNALIMSYNNMEYLKANTAIRAAIQYSAIPTEQAILNALAGLLGIPNILVGNAIKNTAKEGQSFVGGDIWSDTYVNLAVIAPNGQDLSQPGVGRTFLWTDDSPENAVVEQYRAEDIRSDVFRVRQFTDELLLDASFGHLLKVA